MATDLSPPAVVAIDLATPLDRLHADLARIPKLDTEDAKRMARDLARELKATKLPDVRRD